VADVCGGRAAGLYTGGCSGANLTAGDQLMQRPNAVVFRWQMFRRLPTRRARMLTYTEETYLLAVYVIYVAAYRRISIPVDASILYC